MDWVWSRLPRAWWVLTPWPRRLEKNKTFDQALSNSEPYTDKRPSQGMVAEWSEWMTCCHITHVAGCDKVWWYLFSVSLVIGSSQYSLPPSRVTWVQPFYSTLETDRWSPLMLPVLVIFMSSGITAKSTMGLSCHTYHFRDTIPGCDSNKWTYLTFKASCENLLSLLLFYSLVYYDIVRKQYFVENKTRILWKGLLVM